MKKLLHGLQITDNPGIRGARGLRIILLTVYCLLFTLTSQAAVTNVTSGGAAYSTLSNAVFAAGIGDTLLVSTGIYYETIDVYNKELTIDGKYKNDFSGKVSNGKSIISAPRIFFSYSGSTFDITNSTLTLINLDITKGGFDLTKIGFGGGLDIYYGDVTLYGCSIYTNFARGNGGGIYVNESQLYATNTYVFGNNVNNGTFVIGDNGSGGGVYAYKSAITFLNGSKIFFNKASQRGGGVRLYFSDADFRYTMIHSNYANEGGGVAAYSSLYNQMSSCVLYNNMANTKGGGLLLENNSTATNSNAGAYIGYKAPWGANTVTNGSGGGVYLADSTFVLMNFAGILNNSASVYGGGIYSTNGVLNVYNAFVGVTSGGYTNSAYQGGGICALDSTLYFTNSVISHGLSTFAGGILLYNCYSTMENVHVINNWSSGYGGGILLVGSNGFTASQSSFNNNQADIGGGVCLFAEDGNINFESCNITNNFAESAGGILVYLSSPVNISGYSSISYNNALYSGGGILSFGGYVNLSGDDLAPLTIMKNTVLLNGIGGGICAVSSYVEGEGNIYVGYNEASYGGGIYVTNASIVLTNVFSIAPKVFGNIAGKDGGGIYITGTNSVAKLYNTQIGVENFGNESHAKYGTGNGGGGLAAADSARVDLLNCGFADNFSSNSGGGAYFEKNVTVNMDSYDRTSYQSYFHNNIARNAGGGLYVNEAKSLVVENTYVISNKTLSGGAGGVYISKTSSKLVNLVVAQNNSGYSLGAGGIFFFNCPKSEMLQCTVADNGRIGVYNNLGAALYITNCIVYGHSLSQLWNRAEINVAYSDIKNGWPGMGNIDSNPMFDAPSALNYRIVIGSPCENTGIDLPSITNDISGTIRPQGAGWDMGAYEVVPEGGMVIWIVGLLQLWFVGRKKFDFKN